MSRPFTTAQRSWKRSNGWQQHYLGRAEILALQKRHEEAVVLFDAVWQRFHKHLGVSLRSWVALAANGAGFQLLCEAKRALKGGNRALARGKMAASEAKLKAAKRIGSSGTVSQLNRGMILGNLGYLSFLQGHRRRALSLLTRAIQIGGDEVRKLELRDSKVHPLASDREFRALVSSI